MSIPNGAKLGGNRYAQMRKLMHEGFLPGAPDLVMMTLAPRDGKPVCVEVKRPGGKLSTAQRIVLDGMLLAGWHVVVAYGFEDGERQLRRLGY